MEFNIFATIASLLGGAVYYFIGELIYRSLRGVINGPLLMAIYFLGLALCVFLTVFILSKLLGNYRHIHFSFGRTIATILLITVLGSTIVSAGTEFLYELGIGNTAKPKNYIFLIDNSGSMDDNDPSNKRREIVEDVANSLPEDTNIGIYTFGDNTEEIFALGAVKPGSVHIPPSAVYADGRTALYGCIQDVVSKIPADKAKDNTKLVVLTDGTPTDHGYADAVKLCNNSHVAISCVGFGNYNESTFIDLANRTGGNFMPAANIDQLKTSVSEIINKNPINRDLISARNDSTSNSILYAILRVLFIVMIGMVFTYFKYLNAALPKGSVPFFIACGISALIGGLCVEVLFKMYLVETIGRLVLCLAFAFTPLLSNGYYTRSGSGAIRGNTPF